MHYLKQPRANTGGQCTPKEGSPKASLTPGLQVRRCHVETSCFNVAVDFHDERG